MPPRRPSAVLPELFTGTGDLAVSGLSPDQSPGGVVLQDGRPSDFWGRVTGRTSGNAYTFDRCDDAGGQNTFPALSGMPADAYAYETTNRTDVPTDGTAVVRLFARRGAAGYGFVYASPAASVYDSSSAAGDVTAAISTDIGLSVTLPSAGDYEVSGLVTAVGEVAVAATVGNAEAFMSGGVVRVRSPGDYVSLNPPVDPGHPFDQPGLRFLYLQALPPGGVTVRDYRTTGFTVRAPGAGAGDTVSIYFSRSSFGAATWTVCRVDVAWLATRKL